MSEIVFNDQNFNQEVIKSCQPVLVDFFSPLCSPCQISAPVIKELAEEFRGKAKVGKLDVTENKEIPQRYEVRGVPTLIIFKNGEAVQRATGLRSKKVIAEKINSLI
jgi:thioredoxin 1